nr:hypothetical protein [Prevotella sp.]
MRILFLLTVLLTFTLSFCITSCSSDDDDNPSLAFDSNTIVGEWTITEVSGISEWYWIKEGKTLTFKNDGSCLTGFSMENAYRIKNSRVETFYKDTEEPMLIYTLQNNSNGILTVKVSGTLDESNLSVSIKMKRIN